MCIRDRSIRCFDLIHLLGVTACLGISLLNDEGVASACEGEVESALAMMVLRELTHQPSFMANLASVDTDENTITLAHCTVATRLCRRVTARSHYESGLSVALRGELPLQRVTVCRLGRGLDQMLILTGTIVENPDGPEMCRTQVKVRVDGDASTLLSLGLGNHHIRTLGDHRQALMEFCRLRGIQPLTIGGD